MDTGQAVWTALCITRGVHHAHEYGIVHHDLKPGNILFRSMEPYEFDIPKIADWGLAKLLLEHSKSVDGLSPQYSAPEQFDDEYGAADKQTDIYQLGAVFYDLFTGQPPFEGSGSSVMYDILESDPDPPTAIEPSLPDEIDEIVMRCLAKEKSERYETIVYLRDDLEELLGE